MAIDANAYNRAQLGVSSRLNVNTAVVAQPYSGNQLVNPNSPGESGVKFFGNTVSCGASATTAITITLPYPCVIEGFYASHTSAAGAVVNSELTVQTGGYLDDLTDAFIPLYALFASRNAGEANTIDVVPPIQCPATTLTFNVANADGAAAAVVSLALLTRRVKG